MKWLQITMLSASLAAPSYALAAPPEAYLGRPAVQAQGARKPADDAVAASIPAGSAAQRSGAAVKRYGEALNGLKPERHAATRGAAETRIYEQASPSVVLIVTPAGLGSGVVVGADGRIVTNLHVAGDFDTVGVIYKPAEEGASIEDAVLHKARVLRRDEKADLALVQVDDLPTTIKPLAIGNLDAVRVGADVHAIGHPTGEAWSYTRGIVSQVRRDYAWTARGDRFEHEATVIQTQTPINPGNSGGPLLNDKLEVVGINSFKAGGEGLNFAVSADDVKALLARTEDRAATKRSNAPDGVCKAAEIDSRPSKDPTGVEYLIDADCDDEGDYSVLIPKSRRDPILTMLDTDGDREIDTILVDKNHDGEPETGLYDTDGDGKVDLVGAFRKGEDEPYKWEKIKD
ncbi:MAG: trypsin-like serine protease [Phenylobacterium sp.]|uniref:S1C family serine protease n=1 Tax=Phenylobacterium sp. TaxID=1871053 RepID=UPI0025D80DE3|nr:trypsin-like peptidase domain-containing protein [Phenylobacterium sp.]MBI1196867.1 trypsin-like serine protease [Phenylobacterium sp.]